jgi:hypothetical protein
MVDLSARDREDSLQSVSLELPNIGQRPSAGPCLCRKAHVLGSRVKLPKAIEHRCFDPVFGVARKDALLLGIEFVGGVEKTENTGMHQIVQVHVNRQILVHANGDGPHQGEVLHNQTVVAGNPGCGLFAGICLY